MMKLMIILYTLLAMLLVSCNEQYPPGVINANSSTTTTPSTVTTTTGSVISTSTDTDADGIPDYLDNCPSLAAGTASSIGGCPDADYDGVVNPNDSCSTPTVFTSTSGVRTNAIPVTVDSTGCSDRDSDGVKDGADACDFFNASASTSATVASDTPTGASVTAYGCPYDTDYDGVYNGLDKCASTPTIAIGFIITTSTSTSYGCADVDYDGYHDEGADSCPNEYTGTTATTASVVSQYVDAYGCISGFEVKLTGGNDTNMVIHPAVSQATTASISTVAGYNNRCFIPSSYIGTATFSLIDPANTTTPTNANALCWVDANELSLFQNNLQLHVGATFGACDFVFYDPYFFYRHDPGPESLLDFKAITSTVPTSTVITLQSSTVTVWNVNNKLVTNFVKVFKGPAGGALPSGCNVCYVDSKDTRNASIPPYNHPASTTTVAGIASTGTRYAYSCGGDPTPSPSSCAMNYTNADGTTNNCDITGYQKVEYYVNYEHSVSGTVVFAAGSTATTADTTLSVAKSVAGSFVAGTYAALCPNGCDYGTGMVACPGGSPSTKAAADTVAAGSCGYDYTNYGGSNCDSGTVTAQYNLVQQTASGTCTITNGSTYTYSCGGTSTPCSKCYMTNTPSGGYAHYPDVEPLVYSATVPYNLDGNSSNDSLANPDPSWAFGTYTSCGGARKNCMVGPGMESSFVHPTSGLPIGTFWSALTGSYREYTHTSPLSAGFSSNMRNANWLGFNRYASNTSASAVNYVNSCTTANVGYNPEILTDYAMSATTNTISGPHKGAQPFYTFYCLDSAFDIKAQIRVQVRDFDRSVYSSSAYSTDTATARSAAAGSAATRWMDVPGVDVISKPYTDYWDWDDLLHYPDQHNFTAPGTTIDKTHPACAEPTSDYPFPGDAL